MLVIQAVSAAENFAQSDGTDSPGGARSFSLRNASENRKNRHGRWRFSTGRTQALTAVWPARLTRPIAWGYARAPSVSFLWNQRWEAQTGLAEEPLIRPPVGGSSVTMT